MTATRQALGRAGEDAALQWYIERGFALVHRNWRCRFGEIDLILGDGATLVFCEVKTRSSSEWGGALSAVGFDKQRRCRSLAARLVAVEPWHPGDIRFDVAAVTNCGGRLNVEVIVDAF